MNRAMLDFYTNVLLSSFSRVGATRAAALTDNVVSHDRVTRFLRERPLSSRDLWWSVKHLVEWIKSPDAVLVVDDTIVAKPYMDESPIICWFYDHTKGHAVKGMNLLSVVYHSLGTTLPVGYEIVKKTKSIVDEKTGKERRVSEQTKNDLFRRQVGRCAKNMPFRYVISDVWFASAENMMFLRHTPRKHFVMPLKSNRKVALSGTDKRSGKYVTVEDVFTTRTGCRLRVFLEGVDFPLILIRRVFKNEDDSHGILYLVTSDTTLTEDAIVDLYQKRWKVEEYHKALKQQCALGHSPARTVRTQSSHVFCSLWAFVKLELLHMSTGASYEGIKLQIYFNALKTSFNQVLLLDPFQWAEKQVFA